MELSTTIKIPKGYSEKERKSIAKDVIDYIIERTQDENLDKDNRPFVEYSPEYIKSRNFRIAGKNEDKVDLTLSGEMLNSMKVISTDDGSITIGYKNISKKLAGKIEGNILGTYGNDEPVTKGRDFLGVMNNNLSKDPKAKFILDFYPQDDQQQLDINVLLSTIARKAAKWDNWMTLIND